MTSVSTHLISRRPRRRARRLHLLPLLLASAVGAAAVAFVAYVLWPSWRNAASSDPERLPITIGSALFNVPANAIRTKMQRRAGPQERIDLSFIYPSLAPPKPQGRVTAANADDRPAASDRIFLSIASEGDLITPQERVRTIYPRYVEPQSETQEGLTGRAFRDSSPYRGEDLFLGTAPSFVARCTRDAMTPGMCLSERRVDGAHLTFRFSRARLSDWRGVAAAMDRLVERLHSRVK